MEEPARDASGPAPGQKELVGKGEICWLGSSVLLWQKRERWSVAREAPCSSTYLEEEVVPTKVVVDFFQMPTLLGAQENGLTV